MARRDPRCRTEQPAARWKLTGDRPAVGPKPGERVDLVRELFDAKAPTWSAKYAPDGRLTGRLAELTGALRSQVPANRRLLDLGCGTGQLARAAAADGMQVTACDIAMEMLVRAVKHDPEGTVEWLRLDPGWRTLPFDSASFDAVVASSVLEYVDDPSAVFGECRRVLRPGGALLCTVPDLRHSVRWLEWAASLAARTPMAVGMGRHWPRLDGYLTYLRISRQRHLAGWWRTQAALVGLFPVLAAPGGPRSPLRLLMFRRSDSAGEYA